MNRLPARYGLLWIRAGFALFKARPFFLTNLLFFYMLVVIFSSMIPFIGQFVPIFTASIFSFLFMTATVKLERNEPLTITGLFQVLNRESVFRLLALGSCYALFGMIAAGISTLVDHGQLFALLMAKDESVLAQTDWNRVGMSAGLILAVYIPFFMGTWFAGPLIGWRQMSLGKALFYSFFSVAHAWRAFLAYMVSWVLIGVAFPMFVGMIVGPLAGGFIGGLILYVLSVGLTTIMYCSFYPTYREIFGIPITDPDNF